MTIGPAPMIRIEEMSVRLGIASVCSGTKKGRAACASLGRRQGSAPRRRVLDQIRRGGKLHIGRAAGAFNAGRDLETPPSRRALRIAVRFEIVRFETQE